MHESKTILLLAENGNISTTKAGHFKRRINPGILDVHEYQTNMLN
jgi:hypothetical protein